MARPRAETGSEEPASASGAARRRKLLAHGPADLFSVSLVLACAAQDVIESDRASTSAQDLIDKDTMLRLANRALERVGGTREVEGCKEGNHMGRDMCSTRADELRAIREERVVKRALVELILLGPANGGTATS